MGVGEAGLEGGVGVEEGEVVGEEEVDVCVWWWWWHGDVVVYWWYIGGGGGGEDVRMGIYT